MKYHWSRNRPRALRRSANVKEATSEERDECATKTLAEKGESLGWSKNDSMTQVEEGQLGETSVVFEGAP